MPESDDSALLREFAENQSESAFATLVERHVNLVYSVALRRVGHFHAAEEIAQAVFIILARKARSLSKRTVLSGWLRRTTRLTAANYLRTEIRRQNREQEAYMQTILNRPAPEIWPQIAPLLDDAVEQLGEKDRNAIVLRFFENKNLREVGAALGASEDAAKMRVNRALEKLRKFFTKRGVTLSAAAIASAVSTQSVHAAPIGLAKSVTFVALAKGATTSISTITLVKGALKIMAWTKVKTAIVAGSVVILAAGTVTPFIVHYFRASASIFSSTSDLSASDNRRFQSLTGTTPAQVAKAFFEACSQEDWTTADKYWPPGLLNQRPAFINGFTNIYGGLEIISLGKPFKARISFASLPAPERKRLEAHGVRSDFEYPGVYVPYKIRLKDGTVKKWQLAIRCDNPERKWYFDGGL